MATAGRAGEARAGAGSDGGPRGCGLARLVQRHLEPGLEVLEGPLGVLHGDVAPAHEGLGVELPDRALGLDDGVHPRLGVAGVVPFVVAVSPVAHQVDDDVLVEFLAEPEGEAGGPQARLGVVAVHMEDRRLHHLGDIGRVQRRTGRLGGGREPQLVVDHHVDGAPGAITGQLR